MNPAEVVPGHVESHGCFRVAELLAKGVHQTGEPSQMHVEAEG